MTLGNAGCLITDSPDFAAPQQVGPFLTNLLPPPGSVEEIKFEPGTTTYQRKKPIAFDIVSEDLGQELTALVVFDFRGLNGPAYPVLNRIENIKPETLRSAKRGFTSPIDLNELGPITADCHKVALVVSHAFKGASLQPVKPGDVDFETWFYQVDVRDGIYYACDPDPTPTDAGADTRADPGGS
ncbi:MAG TPA: hypothetical protein VK550_13615 [Polyangiaceae bacterium]|nr:hypothetical protein [Polyangiaceae bacterium]